MKKRNPFVVFLLGFITLGFYSWYWAIKTKGELNKLGVPHIPTAWIWLIPIVGPIWWYWKYSQGVEKVTNNQLSAVLTFIILYFLGFIGQAILQVYFNKVGDAQPATAAAPAGGTDAAPAAAPAAPAEQPAPAAATTATEQPVPAAPAPTTTEAPATPSSTDSSPPKPPANLVQ